MKRLPKNFYMDRLHRGFVFGCVALTAYGTFSLFHGIYHYFTVSKPLLLEKQKALLKEPTGDNAPQLQ